MKRACRGDTHVHEERVDHVHQEGVLLPETLRQHLAVDSNILPARARAHTPKSAPSRHMAKTRERLQRTKEGKGRGGGALNPRQTHRFKDNQLEPIVSYRLDTWLVISASKGGVNRGFFNTKATGC